MFFIQFELERQKKKEEKEKGERKRKRGRRKRTTGVLMNAINLSAIYWDLPCSITSIL